MTARLDTPLLAELDATAGPLELTTRADYFEGQIDLKAFRVKYPQYPALSTNPLVIEPERSRYVYITKFGAVVFWNCPDELRHEIWRAIGALAGSAGRIDEVSDSMTVRLGHDADRVTFNDVSLTGLTLEKLKIISLALGQSVALERFENEVTRVLNQMEPVTRALAAHGRLTLSPTEVLKAVGFALEVRGAVLANLTLFEDPPETWESEALAHLDGQLFGAFDLEERIKAINQKLQYLNDMHGMLLDLLNHRSSLRLEWIIIILIFIEIFFSLWLEVLPRFGIGAPR